MSENVTNELIFETLKAMQAELVASRERDAEVMRRLAGIETAVARLGRDQAQTYADQMDDRHGMDAIRTRLERIERRLEITD